MISHPSLWGLVLAGGEGTRLQPLTRRIAGAPIPKQYCRIIGSRSLLERTLARIAPAVPRQRTLVVIDARHRSLARAQLAALPRENVLAQPRNLDTGPGLLFSMLEIAQRDPDATVAVFPSDHDVRCEDVFRREVAHMCAVVERCPDKIVLCGVRPEWADPGYGYLIPGRGLEGIDAEAFHVSAFCEKPSAELATRIVGRGGLWNTFVFVCRVRRVLDLLRLVRPHDVCTLGALVAGAQALSWAYARLSPWSFSSEFLTRVPHALAVLSAEDMGWSDWGTQESIERTLASLGIEPPWREPATAREAAALERETA